MPDLNQHLDRVGPRQVGFEVLGPLYEEFLHRLHLHLRPHDDAVQRLFIARAGVRLRQMYHTFCDARNLQPAPSQVLWASRFLATKALYGFDDDLFFESIEREFRGRRIGAVAKAFSRFEAESLKLGAARLEPVGQMRELLMRGGMPRLHEYLSDIAQTSRAYLREMLQADEQVMLVDSGWHGTIHRLLAPLASVPLTSLYVCRARRPAEACPPGHELVGLLVESDRYDSDQPQSALLHHRHLIEAPLEPPIPSIERAIPNDEGGFSFPESLGSDGVDRNLPSDVAYTGILEYLGAGKERTRTETQSAFTEASAKLAAAILHPTESDLAALDMGFRTSDFGKSTGAPVLLDPVARRRGDTAERRVTDALWPQGQALLEYGDAAPAVHRKLAGEATERDYFHPWRVSDAPLDHDAGSVAVITRTKDRPVLLRRAAASVAHQTHSNLQWVVVNDGGDLTAVESVIRASTVRRSAITIVSNSTSVGMEAASNLGISFSSTDYVTIHDDDDSWEPTFLERTVDFLQQDTTGYDGVITHTTRISEEITGEDVVIHGRSPYNTWVQSVNLTEMSATNLFAPIAFLFTRSIYDKVGGYREDLPVLGDWDFNLRVLAESDIGVIPERLANYHFRDVGSAVTYGNSVTAGRSTHIEYDALVRNRMFRRLGDDPLGHLALDGYTLRVLRDEVRKVGTAVQNLSKQANATQVVSSPPTRNEATHPLRDPDVLWAVGHAVARQARERHSLPFRVLRRIRRAAPTDKEWHDLLNGANRMDLADIPAPPDFDEDQYLRDNPDVARAIASKRNPLLSGWQHYLMYGRGEGRSRPGRA